MKTINKKYKLFFLLFTSIYNIAFGQSKTGIENYHYMGNKINYTWAPVVHHLTDKGVYAELRYNYEELKTASAYLGKTFFTKGVIECSFTPAAGVVAGNYMGGSLALITTLAYEKLSFYSQAQYTVSAGSQGNDFFYNWSDLYYMQLPWLYTGFTIQQTRFCNTAIKTEPGVLVGFTKGNWTIPVYLFNPLSKKKYFIIGMNVEWGKN